MRPRLTVKLSGPITHLPFLLHSTHHPVDAQPKGYLVAGSTVSAVPLAQIVMRHGPGQIVGRHDDSETALYCQASEVRPRGNPPPVAIEQIERFVQGVVGGDLRQ